MVWTLPASTPPEVVIVANGGQDMHSAHEDDDDEAAATDDQGPPLSAAGRKAIRNKAYEDKLKRKLESLPAEEQSLARKAITSNNRSAKQHYRQRRVRRKGNWCVWGIASCVFEAVARGWPVCQCMHSYVTTVM